jgi:hypothetical protein
VNVDLGRLREKTHIFAEVIQSDEHKSQVDFSFGKKANVVDVAQINQVCFCTIVMIEMLKNNFRQETRAERALRNAVKLVNSAIIRRPLAQIVTQKIAEILLTAELGEEMAQHIVIHTIVKHREIEAGAVDEPSIKGIPRCLVESGVPVAPFPVKPLARFACVQVTESLP